MDLTIALDNSKLDQTYNTPALATLFLFDHQVRWFNDNGGLEFSAGRCDRSAEILYTWADNSDFATPFVAREQDRSHVVGTIDFDDADRRRHGGRRPAGQRHRRHRALPQARAATSSGSPCSRPSTPRTSPRCAPASTTWWGPRRLIVARAVITQSHRDELFRDARRRWERARRRRTLDWSCTPYRCRGSMDADTLISH